MPLDNQIYYLEAGRGRWEGKFSLALTDRVAFRREKLSLRNRFLVWAMIVFQKLFGDSKISSDLRAFPDRGKAGVATNVVRIHRLGMTLYLLEEEYVLDPNGRDIQVNSKERFGPIPFLFRETKSHPAVIHPGGMSSTYFMPLLGVEWTGDYTIRADRAHVDALLKCRWAEAHEVIDRVPEAS